MWDRFVDKLADNLVGFLDVSLTTLSAYLSIMFILVCTIVGLVITGLCLEPIECLLVVLLFWYMFTRRFS